MPKVERTLCRNPDPAKQGTRIPTWKLELVRAKILESVSESQAGIELRLLPSAVRSKLTADQAASLGSITWYTTVVKLHLEAMEEIERVPGQRPQVICLKNKVDSTGGER